MITTQEPPVMNWWKDNFWIILAVAIIIVSVALGLILYCVCRRLFRQGNKLEIAKPMKQKQKDEEMMYENVTDQSSVQLPPLPPRDFLSQQDASPQETPSAPPATYSLVNKIRNKETVSIPSYIEPECDYDDVEMPAGNPKSATSYILIEEVRNKKILSIPSSLEPEGDYDNVEITTTIGNCHFKTTPGLPP